MLALPLVDSHTPPLRVMALHALAYCPRLFYLEQVEEIRIASAAVFAGRELHAGLAADDDGEWTSLELTSERLGLFFRRLLKLLRQDYNVSSSLASLIVSIVGRRPLAFPVPALSVVTASAQNMT